MKRQQEVIITLASIFLVTCAWVGFTLYHDSKNSTISEPLNEDIVPIVPNFNTSVISQLKARSYINPQYNFSNIETLTPTKQPLQSPTPTPTSLPIIQTTETPTSSPTTAVAPASERVSPTSTEIVSPTP